MVLSTPARACPVRPACRRFRIPEAIMLSIGSPTDCARCSGVVAVDLAAGAEATTGKSTREAKERIILGNLHRFIPIMSDRYKAPANSPQRAGASVANDCDNISYRRDILVPFCFLNVHVHVYSHVWR
jgi:hypothetical protein